MKYEKLSNLIDGVASDFLFLDEKGIDIPSAGKFLNQIEVIINEATAQETGQLRRIACGINALLEKIILNGIDQEEGCRAFERGITTMQDIINSFKNTGDYKGDIEDFMGHIAGLTGTAMEQEEVPGDASVTRKESPEEAVQAEEKFEISDESLLRDFITEGLEYMGEIEVNVLNLEQSPEDKEYLNAVFRPFHSIKGVASFLNLNDISGLAHDLENLLDRARSDDLPVTSTLIDIILNGSDFLKEMIGSLKGVLDGERSRPSKPDVSALKDQIKNIDQQVDPGGTVERLGTILVGDGVITGEALEDTLKTAQGPPLKKLGETLIDEGKATSKQVSQALRKQANQVVDASTIRVDVQKLGDIVDMVGELVITQAMIRQSPVIQTSKDNKLIEDMTQLATISSELQKISTALRMVPIKQTFQRMSRLIRDLSKSTGKKIVAEMAGEDTEIDRNMTEEIYSPLVHMVRNSVDHGIETPEERISLGKPEEGVVKLSAFHKGGKVVIEISDDGRGLDKEKILKKAVDKGLVKSSEDLPEREIYRLLFLPGFSTAEKITDISGRGVGMDVVKQAVEKLRGKIEIDSVLGKGSTFIIKLPLTMAIINGMIVRVGKEKYIIPIVAIRQLLRPLRESYNKIAGRGETINVMGTPIPLVRLYDLLSIEHEHEHPWEAVTVVIEGENGAKCILVDEIIGEEEVVIKSLGEGLQSVRGVSGGAIMGDGSVGLILDPEGLFELSEM